MEFEEFCHTGVSKDGRVAEGGAVETKGSFRFGFGDGCGVEDCHCSDGYWVSISAPRDVEKKEVRGIKITFRSKLEMKKMIGDAL